MASTSGDARSGNVETLAEQKKNRCPKKSHKEWLKCHKRIYLKDKIFNTLLQLKFAAGYKPCSKELKKVFMVNFVFF